MYKMMKKGMFPRIAAVMLMLTLLSTCVISGTFAKYTTTGNTSASARVAKWGVEINAENGGSPFSTSYATDDEGAKVSASLEQSVKAGGEKPEAVFAPGTRGTLGSIGLTGTPEVAVRTRYDSKDDTTKILDLGTGWKVSNGGEGTEEEYCPLVFIVKTVAINKPEEEGGAVTTTTTTKYLFVGGTVNGTTIKDVAALEKAVADEVKESSAYFAPGTDLSQNDVLSDVGVTVEWWWPFDANDNDLKGITELSALAAKLSNEKDTKLAEAGAASITFNLEVTVEQVD